MRRALDLPVCRIRSSDVKGPAGVAAGGSHVHDVSPEESVSPMSDLISGDLSPRPVEPGQLHAAYLAGWRACERAMGNALADACQGIPFTAERVVRRLVTAWGVPEVRRAAERPRPGDWPGLELLTAGERRDRYAAMLASWDAA